MSRRLKNEVNALPALQVVTLLSGAVSADSKTLVGVVRVGQPWDLPSAQLVAWNGKRLNSPIPIVYKAGDSSRTLAQERRSFLTATGYAIAQHLLN